MNRGCHVAAPSNGGGNVATPSWSTAELAVSIGRGKNDGTVRRALERLADLGEIYRNAEKRWQRSETLFDGDGAVTA